MIIKILSIIPVLISLLLVTVCLIKHRGKKSIIFSFIFFITMVLQMVYYWIIL
jgi:hypothetical protein